MVDGALDHLPDGGCYIADPALEVVAGIERRQRVDLLSSATVALYPDEMGIGVGRPSRGFAVARAGTGAAIAHTGCAHHHPGGQPMRIGTSIVVMAIGAIMAFAVEVDRAEGFNINTAGIILIDPRRGRPHRHAGDGCARVAAAPSSTAPRAAPSTTTSV